MFARVTTSQWKPERVDDGIRSFRDNVIPVAKKTTGFKGSYLLVDRKSGKSIGIALWDTEKNLQASADAAAGLRAQVSKAAATSQASTVEIYEVAEHV